MNICLLLTVRHKFKHLIMQGGSGVNTNNSGLRSSCRGIVDYCYAFPLLTPEGLQEIYDDLAESQNYSDKDHSDEHKSDNSDEARGGSGLNKMTFSIHISNISNQSLATATTSSKVRSLSCRFSEMIGVGFLWYGTYPQLS